MNLIMLNQRKNYDKIFLQKWHKISWF